MRLTNNSNLPEGFVRAIQNDSYDSQGSDFTPSKLNKPAQMVILEERHNHELVEDASDRVWSLLGQAAHSIAERAAKETLVEKRFFAQFGTYKVSAQIDSLNIEAGRVSDYKVTSVYAVKGDVKREWEQQLNVQAELLRQSGYDIKHLEIIAILRDWSRADLSRDIKDGFNSYPKAAVVVVPVLMWPREKTVEWINKKIEVISEARKKVVDLPHCSSEDMWEKPSKFAVMKKGAKKATKLFDNEAHADLLAKTDGSLFVQKRPGARTRCENYCAVSKFCSQYQSYLKQSEEVKNEVS